MSNKLAGGYKPGSVDVRIPVLLRKAADNTEQTGILAASITASYWREGGTPTAITVSDLGSVGSVHSDGGWIAANVSTMPGLYRFDLPDAALATGADWVVVAIKVASTYVFFERYALETQGAAEVYAEVAHASYGLSKLVRATTPANTLTVETDGMAHADLKEWLGSAPLGLLSQLVRAQTDQNSAGAKAEIQVEVAAVVDMAIPELTTDPGATPTLKKAVMLGYMKDRNKLTATPTLQEIRNNAGTVVLKATLSDDNAAPKFTKDKLVNGP